MPVKVVRRNGKYRVVEPSGKISKTKNGKAKDGGGHSNPRKAHAQKAAINKGRKKK